MRGGWQGIAYISMLGSGKSASVESPAQVAPCMGNGKNFDHIFYDPKSDHGSAAVGDSSNTGCKIIPRRSAFGIGGKRRGMCLYLADIFIGRVGISLIRNPFIQCQQVAARLWPPRNVVILHTNLRFSWTALSSAKTSDCGIEGAGSASAASTFPCKIASRAASSRSNARKPARTTSLTEAKRPEATRDCAISVSGPRVTVTGFVVLLYMWRVYDIVIVLASDVDLWRSSMLLRTRNCYLLPDTCVHTITQPYCR